MTSWLKKARRMSGLSAQKLADACGFSLNYIQRLESGERSFAGHAEQTICSYLEFSPKDISIDFDKLESSFDKLIEQDGETSFCLARYIRRSGIRIPIDFLHWNGTEEELSSAAKHPNITNVQVTPLRLQFAKEEIKAQRCIYDNPAQSS